MQGTVQYDWRPWLRYLQIAPAKPYSLIGEITPRAETHVDLDGHFETKMEGGRVCVSEGSRVVKRLCLAALSWIATYKDFGVK
jgi:hypothetical protein